MIDLPDAITPEQLAKRLGFSPRKIRELARDLGACRIVGNKMMLLQQDVDAILEATKPKPRAKPGYHHLLGNTLPPAGDYEALKIMLEEKKGTPKRARSNAKAGDTTEQALRYLAKLRSKKM